MGKGEVFFHMPLIIKIFLIYMNKNISHGEYQALLWAVLRNSKINVSVKVAQ